MKILNQKHKENHHKMKKPGLIRGTELPLILNQSDFDEIEVPDTSKIHVESIVSGMLMN
jgi:aspartate/glutamate racemase